MSAEPTSPTTVRRVVEPQPESAAPRSVPVTAIVMTKNESANIAKCLASMTDLAEIFVVDSKSTDGTQSVAMEAGATVVDFVWDGKYPKKKQWCLDNLPFSNDWVLFVDADEELTSAFVAETALAVNSLSHSAYFAAYDYVFAGRTLRHGRIVHKLVLVDRRYAHFPVQDDLDAENMWEVEGHYQPVIKGSVGSLNARMIHNDNSSLFDFFARHNRYSDWEATLNTKSRVDSTDVNLRMRLLRRFYARLPCKSILLFTYFYIVRRGYLDGRAGFDYAVAMSFYTWQIELKKREIARRGSD